MYLYLKLYKNTSSDLDIKIFSLIMIFFVGYTVFSSSPFAGCIELAAIGCSNSTILPFQELVTSSIGRGPNPLLQNHPLMAIHPPMLYVGYVGMTMPFVAATGRLYSKQGRSNDWVEVAEKTTYIPWLFLTIGITLGAAWSYEVLGWGGYWAWDPVENVSFIPWLLATAFLHSAKIQKSQNTLLNWNYILVGLMFLSTIFGTFITRSGVLISVHAFSNGNIGTYLLFGMLLFSLIFIVIGSKNIDYFSKSKKIDNWFGKSGFFVYNNIFLFSAALVVFIGTIFPLIYETLYDRQITIGRSYYDVIVGPLLLILLGLMIFSIKLPIKNLNFKKWTDEKRPTNKEIVGAIRSKYIAAEIKSLVINKDEVNKNITNNKFQLLDARGEQRFLGLQPEPRKELKSGNIKGSINLPFQKLLKEDRTLKKKEDLIEIFKSKKVSIEKEMAFTCGSGVTACILGLANSIISGKKPVIYDGSWAEYGLD